jgi:hypothetical protein
MRLQKISAMHGGLNVAGLLCVGIRSVEYLIVCIMELNIYFFLCYAVGIILILSPITSKAIYLLFR